MKKYIFIVLLTSTLLACNSGSKSTGSEQKRVLTVTIEPQRYFLKQIVGENFTVNTLVPPGTSPETYEPAPSVMVDMANSSHYFKVGDLGFEKAWSRRLADNNPDVVIVDCSDGIELIMSQGHEHEGHYHGEMDPHVWSSPSAIKIFTMNMLESVISTDPDDEEFYRSNYSDFIARVDSTDKIIREILQDSPSRSFIIYHPALSYFALDYDLHQYSMEFEGKSPSPSQLRELVDLARNENINTVFIQRGFDSKNAEVIANEIGAEVFEINPLNYDWNEELIRIASIIGRKQ